MSFRNAIVGIAIGLMIVALIKQNESVNTSSAVAVQTVSAVAGSSVAPKDLTTATLSAEPTATIESAAEAGLIKQAPILGDDRIDFDHDPSRLKVLLRESIAEAQVASPSQSELDQFEQLFLATLQRSAPWQQIEQGWSQNGWTLQRWESGGEKFVAVCEQSNQRRGRGVYVIRMNTQSPIALQAPHRFYDAKTGLLIRKLFSENDILAAAWNTVHREQIDLAHRSDHFINAMTRALIKSSEAIVIGQIHGFANEKQTGAAQSASIIISDTTRYPGRLVRRAAEGLKATLGPEAVRLYPTEVSQLGGTRNQQARVFHNLGRSGFLHVELNFDMRAKLTTEASLRAQFFSALTDAAVNR